NWDREQREPLLSKVTDRIHHQEPLKEKISQCVYKLKVQQNRLEGANLKTQQHDKSLFDKCVQAQMAKDTMRSAMYANEIAEIRKIAKVTLRSELALEQVVLRLETIQDRKSTRLNSSHDQISYAVFCLKKKKVSRRPPQPLAEMLLPDAVDEHAGRQRVGRVGGRLRRLQPAAALLEGRRHIRREVVQVV